MTEPPVRPRPLSPHLQIYRPMLTMMMSITNRITGSALYLGMALFVLWLAAVASGPDIFSNVQVFYGSWFGLLILFGLTWALMAHAIGGIRHLIWDTGRGLEIPSVEAGALIMAVGSLVLTFGLWIAIWFGFHG